MTLKPLISVVSPVYNGEKMVHELVSRIMENLSQITEKIDIILVNDASHVFYYLSLHKSEYYTSHHYDRPE